MIILGIALLLASVAVYFIHYLIFDDAHHIFIYMVGDIAFVFIEVLLVTLIIPPVAILLGALVLGETLHPRAFAGFAVIGLGLLVLNGTLRWPWPRPRATRD